MINEDVFMANSSKHGWCNDPQEAYSLNVEFNKECACRLDCYSGKFCELTCLHYVVVSTSVPEGTLS